MSAQFLKEIKKKGGVVKIDEINGEVIFILRESQTERGRP